MQFVAAPDLPMTVLDHPVAVSPASPAGQVRLEAAGAAPEQIVEPELRYRQLRERLPGGAEAAAQATALVALGLGLEASAQGAQILAPAAAVPE